MARTTKEKNGPLRYSATPMPRSPHQGFPACSATAPSLHCVAWSSRPLPGRPDRPEPCRSAAANAGAMRANPATSSPPPAEHLPRRLANVSLPVHYAHFDSTPSRSIFMLHEHSRVQQVRPTPTDGPFGGSSTKRIYLRRFLNVTELRGRTCCVQLPQDRLVAAALS